MHQASWSNSGKWWEDKNDDPGRFANQIWSKNIGQALPESYFVQWDDSSTASPQLLVLAIQRDTPKLTMATTGPCWRIFSIVRHGSRPDKTTIKLKPAVTIASTCWYPVSTTRTLVIDGRLPFDVWQWGRWRRSHHSYRHLTSFLINNQWYKEFVDALKLLGRLFCVDLI